MSLPTIIQGGMGVGVSSWRLARTVAQLGQLGVVSGALLAVVFARRLQEGDVGGHLRHAMAFFPFQDVAEKVLEAYYIPEGKSPSAPYKAVPMPAIDTAPALLRLTVAASFAEVFLAKEGHEGSVGINLLEKIQVSSLPTLYGAMLAKVDYVLMGAGIPKAIPGVLDRYAAGQSADLRIDVDGAKAGEDFVMHFDPRQLGAGVPAELPRPRFLPIVSSSVLAANLAKKSSGRVDGFIIEGSVAGGHNAPPRGTLQLNESGEPIYGIRDLPDLAKFRELGLPFWLAGAYGEPGKLAEAKAAGATGIQVGTAFAFCKESGMDPVLRRRVLELSKQGRAKVFTDPLASPTGFPFKVLGAEGTLSEGDVYAQRSRVCDLGYLRQPYLKEDGSLGYRCAAEDTDAYLRKGGTLADTVGRKCLCNGLAATIGHGQWRAGTGVEPPIITAGDEVSVVARFLRDGQEDYSAADVVRHLLG